MKWLFGKNKAQSLDEGEGQRNPATASNFDQPDDFTDKNTIQGLNDFEEIHWRQYYIDKAEHDLRVAKEVSESLSAPNIPMVIGAFVKPENATWTAHVSTIKTHDLAFNPRNHAWFDGTIAEMLESQLPAVVDSSGVNYSQYEPLRLNLAVLRNFVYNHFFPNGNFSPETDTHKVVSIIQIAMEVGTMISRGADMFPDALQPNAVALAHANQEGGGAVELYSRLHGMNQGYEQARILHGVRELVTGDMGRDWQLPPIDQTPFGRLNLISEPTDVNYINQTYQAQMSSQHDGVQSAALMATAGIATGAIKFSVEDLGDPVITAMQARAVEDLSQSVKQESIRIAKDILENLRIQCGSMSIKELIDSGNIPLIDDVLSGVVKVTDTFDHHVKIALKLDPSLMNDLTVKESIEALGIFQYHSKLQAADKASIKAVVAEHKGEKEQAATLRAEASMLRAEAQTMPASYKAGSSIKVSELLTKIEQGMDKVVARMQEMTQTSLGAAGALSRDMMPDMGKQTDKQSPLQQVGQQQQAQQEQQQMIVNAATAIAAARAARQAARIGTNKEAQATSGTSRRAPNASATGQTQGAGQPTNAVVSQSSSQSQNTQMGQDQAGQQQAITANNTALNANMPPLGTDPLGKANNIRPASLASRAAATSTNVKATVKAPRPQTSTSTPPTQAQPIQTQSAGFSGMQLDPALLSGMKERMASVAGMKENTDLAPNSAARTIATLKNEQEQQRMTASTAKQATKSEQTKTQHDHDSKTAQDKAAQELAAAQQQQPPAFRKNPTITR